MPPVQIKTETKPKAETKDKTVTKAEPVQKQTKAETKDKTVTKAVQKNQTMLPAPGRSKVECQCGLMICDDKCLKNKEKERRNLFLKVLIIV